MFTIYSSNAYQEPSNCSYPNVAKITDEESLKTAVSHDYVCAEYKNFYRSSGNFISSDCLPVDCDNDHSENPADWKKPSDIRASFPGVSFAVHYSRHHNRVKGGKSARPRFHALFSIEPVTDADEYASLKKLVNSVFPYFDTNALDAARFFFGTKNPQAELFPGTMTLTEFFCADDDEFDAGMESGREKDAVIPEGSRNTTMSRFAGRVIKKYGNTAKARQVFLDEAAKCVPPLSDQELNGIWRSAKSFYSKISRKDDYVPPEEYNRGLVLKPEDFSDVGQASVLSRAYAGSLRYSPSTDYLVYNGSFWEESKPKAQGTAHELTKRQLEEAGAEIARASDEMNRNGAWELIARRGEKNAAAAMDPRQLRSYDKYRGALAYRTFVIKRRDSKYITAVLREARPMLEIQQTKLDKDAFLLNTPSATYDLRSGLSRCHKHAADDFITKQTSVDPSGVGTDKWLDALDTFFLGDAELISYVQEIAGLSAIGRVCVEALIIAYGEGRNGKSTFWNTISRVLGTYSGNISADTLTVGCRRNVKPELAEAKGKRLLIAAELEEGMRLNTSSVKQLCSTDEIYAEKKYKEPFSYVPSHTLVLYTNHLPKVGAIDRGTWRRLIVIPFSAKIEGKSEIKNYADYLYENAGGAVLSWIMEGAERVIRQKYKLTEPRVVTAAIAKYKEENDWLSHFLDECCEIGSSYTEKSGEVYSSYRDFCQKTGDYTRSTTDFYTALDFGGFNRQRTKAGIIIHGLMLKSDFFE